ncbi:hypothetical protein M23134_03540 [Microscilla marina ATCC 23134]|uniref:Uncharacterized protein n=1 Tax=Microscilla marina ATCC 23134 TaxID=313606 RepID=A1ZN97_MICM2|nr:hypothetical protein M23134_03540 [Microscilla marina ATCC 23134]
MICIVSALLFYGFIVLLFYGFIVLWFRNALPPEDMLLFSKYVVC